MKFHGEKLEGPNVEIVVIPRGSGKKDVVFHCQAVLDSDAFDALCPVPKPREIIKKGGKREAVMDDPGFQAAVLEYCEKKNAWLVLESLKGSPGLEWETVSASDSTTWLNYKSELKESGFSEIEIVRIERGVAIANCLNEQHVEQARESFLQGLAAE